jgi:N-methylhydantoinase A/oxoprolinase/acetone carboxylase beta subunit
VSFSADDGYQLTPVYLRDRMSLNFTCSGPAVIADAGSTTVVPPGWNARMEPLGTLLLVRDPS